MRIRSLIAGATLLAQSTSVPALAQDEAKPGVTDAQSAPNVGAANAIPLSMLGFGDREKLCLVWSDGCVTLFAVPIGRAGLFELRDFMSAEGHSVQAAATGNPKIGCGVACPNGFAE